jgi:hypothetical protein
VTGPAVRVDEGSCTPGASAVRDLPGLRVGVADDVGVGVDVDVDVDVRAITGGLRLGRARVTVVPAGRALGVGRRAALRPPASHVGTSIASATTASVASLRSQYVIPLAEPAGRMNPRSRGLALLPTRAPLPFVRSINDN